MKKKVVWLVVTGLMVAALLLASCAPAVVEEKKVAPPKEKEVVAPPKEKEVVVVPEKGAEMVKLTLTKLDGTVVEKMVEKPRYGGVITLGHPSDIFGFDPGIQNVPTSPNLTIVFEELVYANWYQSGHGTGEDPHVWCMPTLAVNEAGGLAESWEFPDPDTVIFHIRKGVRYALNPKSEASRLLGGREINAYDIAWSMNRDWNNPKSFLGIAYPRLLLIESITAPDKWTVVVKVKPGKMGVIYSQASSVFKPVPREVVEKYGDMMDWRNHVGTGAYMLVDYVEGSSFTLVRNPNYWMKDPLHPENQLPYMDGFRLLVIPDTSTRLAALRTAKVDHLDAVRWEDAESLMKTNPALKYKRILLGSTDAMYMRVDNPELPWYNLKVRQALSMAVDRPTLIKTYYGGNAEVLAWPIPPESSLMDYYIPFDELPQSTREVLTYNPEKARQLLAEAGYPQGFKAEAILLSTDVDLASIVKEYWAKIGVTLELQVKERAVVTSMSTAKSHKQMFWGTMSNSALWRYFSLVPGHTSNRSIVDDARFNETYYAIHADWLNFPKISRLVKGITPYILEQAWATQLVTEYTYTIWQPWVKAYDGEDQLGYCNPKDFVNYIWYDQDLKEAMTGRR